MALNNYSGLKEEIAAHIVRDDLASRIDTFIDIAEARHKREIRIREMVQRAQATATTRFLALPQRFTQMINFRALLEGGRVHIIEELNLHEMNRRHSIEAGVPNYYTVHEEIEFDREPVDPLSVEMVYYQSFTPLSDQAPSNGLLLRAPDCYLYAALVASAPFLIDDERIQVWEGLYASARDELLAADRRSRHGGPLVSRVAGPTP
jgi:hypothetical protein